MKPPAIKMASDSVALIELQGDKHKRPEPETVRISFPGGECEVTRCSDGSYWVHATALDAQAAEGTDNERGAFIAARLDTRSQHASETNLGDFGRPDLYHVAFRVGKVTP